MASTSYHYEMEHPIDFVPRRVVSLVPSVTESLFDLGLGDRLVGITDFCVRPAAGVAVLQRVGGTKTPHLESIIALQPDLVIMNREENRREDAEALQGAGIAVWVTFPTSVQDAMNLLWSMMDVFDEASMVHRVRSIEQTVDFISRIELTRTRPCRVFAPIWYDPLMTFTRETFAHDLLRVCGGNNIFAEFKSEHRYPRVTFEDVVDAQPDVILLPNEPYAFDQDDIAEFAALDVPAAHNDNIHLIDGSLLSWHGTRIAHALTVIPALMCSTDDT